MREFIRLINYVLVLFVFDKVDKEGGLGGGDFGLHFINIIHN